MKIQIWTVAADDRLGTRATVHLTEKEAYSQWLSLQFSDYLDENDKKDLNEAMILLEREDYKGLWEWRENRVYQEIFASYVVDVHELILP
jgi:hypothetical protein